jgi:hypothetical protein
MKLSFQDRIDWDEAKGATIPQLNDAEIDEVLREYRPTAENRCCECGGTRVCPACVLTQIIDQVRERANRLGAEHRRMAMLGVEFGFRCGEKGHNLDYTMAKAIGLYDDAKEFTRKMRNDG